MFWAEQFAIDQIRLVTSGKVFILVKIEAYMAFPCGLVYELIMPPQRKDIPAST